jgi:hypothetical protein
MGKKPAAKKPLVKSEAPAVKIPGVHFQPDKSPLLGVGFDKIPARDVKFSE